MSSADHSHDLSQSPLWDLVHKRVRLHQRAHDDGYPVVIDCDLLAVVFKNDGEPIYVVVRAMGSEQLIVPWHSILSLEPW